MSGSIAGLFTGFARSSAKAVASEVKTAVKEEGHNMIAQTLRPSAQPQPQQYLPPQPQQYLPPQSQYSASPYPGLTTHAGCTCTCPTGSQVGGADLEQLTVKELRLLARARNIPGRSKLNRRELLRALEA